MSSSSAQLAPRNSSSAQISGRRPRRAEGQHTPCSEHRRDIPSSDPSLSSRSTHPLSTERPSRSPEPQRLLPPRQVQEQEMPPRPPRAGRPPTVCQSRAESCNSTVASAFLRTPQAGRRTGSTAPGQGRGQSGQAPSGAGALAPRSNRSSQV